MNQSQLILLELARDANRSTKFLEKLSTLMAYNDEYKSRVFIGFLLGMLLGGGIMFWIK